MVDLIPLCLKLETKIRTSAGRRGEVERKRGRKERREGVKREERKQGNETEM